MQIGIRALDESLNLQKIKKPLIHCINNSSEKLKESIINYNGNPLFTNLLKEYQEEMKIVAMNYPADTSTQQKYLTKKINECTNENHMIFLNHRMKQLKVIESKRTNREFFLMIFGKDDKETMDNKNLVLSVSRLLEVYDIDIIKKIKICRKLNNMNSSVN